MGFIEPGIHAPVAAPRRTPVALRRALSERANSLRAIRVTVSAIVRVELGVDAPPATQGGASSAMLLALCFRTHLSLNTCVAAPSAVGRVDLDVHTSVAAEFRPTGALDAALPKGADLARGTFVAAGSAVVGIEPQIHAHSVTGCCVPDAQQNALALIAGLVLRTLDPAAAAVHPVGAGVDARLSALKPCPTA